MTIKRRLIISNIMMLVVPVIVGALALTVIILSLVSSFGVSLFDLLGESEHLSEVIEQVQVFSVEWPSGAGPDEIQADMDRISVTLGREGYREISLAVFLDGELLYTAGTFEDSPFLENALADPGNNQYMMNRSYMYTIDAGEYKVVVLDTNFWLNGGTFNVPLWHYFEKAIGYVLVLMAIVIVLTTRFLSWKVFKSIMTPLDTLINGVRQIRDGDLGYRIDYSGKDEFGVVCADFNEMAERLSSMVAERQKDEETRKELIAGISHDLRTPLTSILTYVEGIEIGLASTPQLQRHYLATIKNKAKDLEHIVSQLFLLAKLDVGEYPMLMKRIDIGSWLSGFVDEIHEEYRHKGLRIELLENAIGLEVCVDIVQLRSVFTNVVDNSLNYADAEHKAVEIICRKESGYATIALTDNGRGVPEDALAKLFHMFYRGSQVRADAGQGSGLGLAISSKIIERFDGTIRAENAEGGGLSVTISLPAVEREAISD